MEIAGTKTRLGVTEVRQELQLPSEGFERTDTCASADVRPNAELTGRRRVDGLAVRPMMNQGGRTAKLASRWRSG
jgi:hypothetical protein